MTAEKTLEIGPIVAGAMIVIGLSTVVWAVATNERPEGTEPKLTVNSNVPLPGTDEPPPPPPVEEGIPDAEWEEVLVDVEKLKTDGVTTDIDVSTQVATVSKEKWDALEESRREAIGKHLAVYCGRVSGSDQYRVTIKDDAGGDVGKYER